MEEPQIMKESSSPRSSEGFVSPITDSNVLVTPKLEHANAQGGNSDPGELPVSNSAVISKEVTCVGCLLFELKLFTSTLCKIYLIHNVSDSIYGSSH